MKRKTSARKVVSKAHRKAISKALRSRSLASPVVTAQRQETVETLRSDVEALTVSFHALLGKHQIMTNCDPYARRLSERIISIRMGLFDLDSE